MNYINKSGTKIIRNDIKPINQPKGKPPFSQNEIIRMVQ